MTYQGDFTLPSELLEQIAAQGFDALPELIRIVINAAMQAERQQYLRAAPYQHTPDRRGHANGFKPKTVKTRLGEITLEVPQVREGGFYPEALEKGQRSERALTLTLAEMYVQGVSTRKVKAITEELCGHEFGADSISQINKKLDGELQRWAQRQLDEEYPLTSYWSVPTSQWLINIWSVRGRSLTKFHRMLSINSHTLRPCTHPWQPQNPSSHFTDGLKPAGFDRVP